MFILKQYNTPVLKFDLFVNSCCKYKVHIVEYYNEEKLPLDFDKTEDGLLFWLKNRTIPSNRANASTLLARIGLNERDLIGILSICKGLSLNDSYWIVEEDFQGDFYNYNLYAQRLSRLLAWIAFSGEGSYSNKTKFRSSPEFTTCGMLAKCWRRENGKLYLYKAGTTGGINTGKEPYSEFYAAQIAEKMKISHVKYGLSKWKSRLCSTCELFTDINTSYIPIYRLIDGDINQIISYYKALGDEFYDALIEMLVFDAIICNEDRHFGNFGVLVDNIANKIIKPAPIFDHGMSLFNEAIKEDFDNIEKYVKTRMPRTYTDFISFVKPLLKEKHKRQIRALINFKFKKHSRYNLEDYKLRQIEKFIQIRIKELLD